MKSIASTGDRKVWSSLFVTRSDSTLEVQNLTIDQTGKIYFEYTLNNVMYMNIQLALNTATWKL